MSAGIFTYKIATPFKALGLTGPFWEVHYDIVIATWIAMSMLLAVAIFCRRYLNEEYNPVTKTCELFIQLFMGLCKDSFSSFNYYYFAFITSLFLFATACSVVGIIPFVEEATRDLNTALALALISFFYILYQKIRIHGFIGFLREFIEPVAILAPIHLIGEVSKIASMSFRLFGNILGGSIILMMIIELIGSQKTYFLCILYCTIGLNILIKKLPDHLKSEHIKQAVNGILNTLFIISWTQLLLGVVEGVIQAFVLTMLTTTYLALGTQQDAPHDHQESKKIGA